MTQCGEVIMYVSRFGNNIFIFLINYINSLNQLNIMTAKENSLNWFEISVKDIKRAKKFYESIFKIKMNEQ